jgi:hypothetical protein
MRNGFKVFDADAHVIYPPDLWSRFLDDKFQSRVSRKPVPGFDHYNPVSVDGRWTQHTTTILGQFQKAINWTTEDMISQYGEEDVTRGLRGDLVAKALEVEGVDVMVIYGPEYDMARGHRSMQAGMARAHNRWGAEMRDVRRPPSSRAGWCLPTTSHASKRSSMAHDHLGIRCFGAPNQFNRRNLGSQLPVSTSCSKTSIALATHDYGANAHRRVERVTTPSPSGTRSCSHEAQTCLSMLVNGVFERFPRLRCAYMEAGCGWLPSWLHRIDEHLELAGANEFPELTMNATEYFRRNCWISTECEDPFVADVIRWMGDDHIVYETDFPHPDSKYPHATRHFLELLPDQISDDSKRKILWDNAVDLYRFPAGYLPDESTFIEYTADAVPTA